MRARELLDEDYASNLEADLGNVLVGAKGTGATELQTQAVVTQLQGMGYSVDSNSIMALLSRNPVVLNATPSTITFTRPEGVTPGQGASGNDAAAQVSSMAQKATKLG